MNELGKKQMGPMHFNRRVGGYHFMEPIESKPILLKK